MYKPANTEPYQHLFQQRIEREAWMIGEAFLKGILLEVTSYPKPGLVSSISMGAHTDMNVLTFMVSSAAISPAFFLCAQAGKDHTGRLSELILKLREIGKYYEQGLLEATRGVNTQRGILFAAGMICGAAGYLMRTSCNVRNEDLENRYTRNLYINIDELFSTVAEMTQGIVTRELRQLDTTKKDRYTAGETLYIKYGAKGIRGEVEEGFPSVRQQGLPAFIHALEKGSKLNECLVHTLISLMTCVEDTTILWRKDKAVLFEVQRKAMEIIVKGSVFTKEGRKMITELDAEFIENNISPGGSADLLAITVGSYLLQEKELPLII